jgi:hypothetical protein
MKPSDFLTELSTEKLAKYKTAAAADASKADKEGDFKRGDKRFSGIVKATKKQFANDTKQGVAEGSQGTSVKAWAAQVRNEHGSDVKFTNDKHGGGTVNRAIARNSQGEIVGVYNRNTGDATVFEPKQGVAEVAGDVNSKERYHFLYPHVPLDMHTDHEYNDLSDRDLQAVKSHQRELANKLGKPGAKEQGDIASHIQINRARSQYDQEQAHRRKVLDAEKIKRQARDAKRKQQSQQGVAEGWKDVVAGGAMTLGALGANAHTMPNINAQQVELANKYYNVLVQRAKEDGTQLDTRTLNLLKAKAQDAAAKKTQQSTHQQGFPSLGSERRVAKDAGQFESQGVAEEKCPHCSGPMFSELMINEKKDACYYKVKSRYKVWPSAYASGALVKCRNKGASNWGNSSKNESSILEGIEQADESLHDWFNKEKWVRMDTKGNIKGPCAKEPGEGKPKCLPQSKAHSLGKKGRASAAARKRREDPNPDRSGKAINVNTKKTKG